jgi:hypothetical protein
VTNPVNIPSFLLYVGQPSPPAYKHKQCALQCIILQDYKIAIKQRGNSICARKESRMGEIKYEYKSLIVNPGGEIPSDQEVNEREVLNNTKI